MITALQKPLYVMEKARDGTGYVLTEIRRVQQYKVSNKQLTYIPAVRYDWNWYPVYDAKKLKRYVDVKRRKSRRNIFYVNGTPHLKADFKMLPYIKCWDQPLGLYKTFGPDGT
ncbi:hypothetical protein [uncultured Sneathiella sp.]|uniref:hypothetical protein n=1 Tax=uncultured Sneathiella sp. TaxID=879315 RepID=UPI0030EDAE67